MIKKLTILGAFVFSLAFYFFGTGGVSLACTCPGNCDGDPLSCCGCHTECVIPLPGEQCAGWDNFCDLYEGPCVNDGTGEYCGDGSCNGGENCSICPADCGGCCTNVNPSTPVLAAPVNGVSFTLGQNIITDWSDVNWGTLCVSPSDKLYMLPYRLGAGSYSTRWPTVSNYNMTPYAICNGNWYWSVAAYNIKQGVAEVHSPTAPTRYFTVSGATGPAVTLTASPSSLATPGTVTLNVTATDPNSNLSYVRLYDYYSPSTYLNIPTACSSTVPCASGWTCSSTTTANGYCYKTCSGGSCTVSYPWTLACQAAKDYVVQAYAWDTCGYNAGSNRLTVHVDPSYSLAVTVRTVPALNPGDTPNCSGVATGALVPGAIVTVAGVGSATTNSSGVATIANIPAALSPVTVTVSYDNPGKSCDVNTLVCNGTTAVAGSAQVSLTGTTACGTKSVTVGIAEQLNASWKTVLGGGIYANNIVAPGQCSATSSETTFGFPTSSALTSTWNTDAWIVLAGNPITTYGQVKSFRYYTANAGESLKFRVYRNYGSYYVTVGDSPTISSLAGENTYTLSTPIPVQPGDMIGVYLGSAVENWYANTGGGGMNWINGSANGQALVSSWSRSTIPYRIPLSANVGQPSDGSVVYGYPTKSTSLPSTFGAGYWGILIGTSIKQAGQLVSFNYGSLAAGETIKLRVYRNNGTNYSAVWTSPNITTLAGENTYTPSAPIDVLAGDMLGFYTGTALETFWGATGGGGVTYITPDASGQAAIGSWTTSYTGRVALNAKVIPTGTVGSGSIMLGYPVTSSPASTFGINFWGILTGTPISVDGQVDSFNTRLVNAESLKFRIYRNNGTNYVSMGESSTYAIAAGQKSTSLDTPLAVKKGDYLGFFSVTTLESFYSATDGAGLAWTPSANGEGTIGSWSTGPASWVPISANIVPDSMGSNFLPYLAIGDTASPVFVRAMGAIIGDNVVNINGGGYAKSLTAKSNDLWIDKYTFPTSAQLATLPSVTTFAALQPGTVSKMTAAEFNSKHGDYNGMASSASIIYITDNADITISNSMTSTGSGIVVVVTQGNVIISGSLGVSNYTNPGIFTTSTDPQVRLGIISLGNVTFATATTPVILEGFIITRDLGSITSLRDLGVQNSVYPSVVLNYYKKTPQWLNALERTTRSGFATYDVQWSYDE